MTDSDKSVIKGHYIRHCPKVIKVIFIKGKQILRSELEPVHEMQHKYIDGLVPKDTNPALKHWSYVSFVLNNDNISVTAKLML